jgi:NTE family protein
VADRRSDDLLLVQINPARRDEVPTAAGDILERVGEITFNASLLKELRMIGLLRTLADAFDGPAGSPAVERVVQRLRQLRLHRIDGGQALAGFGADTKTNTSALFLERLFGLGRQAAQDWLAAHRGDIGRRGGLVAPGP